MRKRWLTGLWRRVKELMEWLTYRTMRRGYLQDNGGGATCRTIGVRLLTVLWGRGYLQDYGGGATCRTRSDRDNCINKAPTTAWVKIHKAWKLGAHRSVCRQLNRLLSVLSLWLSGSKYLPGSSANVCFFGAANLISRVFFVAWLV